MNASGHPFQIRVSSGGAAYNDGVSNNGAQIGEIFFTVPMNAPNELYYQCTIHGGMGNKIYVFDQESFLDSSTGTALINAVVNKTFVDNLNVDADTLDNQNGTYYLDYNNFTNTPNILDSANVSSIIAATDLVDSADVSAIIAATDLVDSADVVLIITNQVDSAYVQARQITYNTN